MNTGQQTSDVATLLDRYLIGLDDDKLDDEWARSLFTEDGVVEFPMSRHIGIDGLARYHATTLANFAATQHVNSPAIVEFVGTDMATLRANLISTHVHHPDAAPEPIFATGTFVTGQARRTTNGWRLALLSFRLVWMTGSPPTSTDPVDAVPVAAEVPR